MARVIGDLTGAQVSGGRDYPIAASTSIIEGSLVMLTFGQVVNVAVNTQTAILGVAQEYHSGAADIMNARSNGREIRIFDSPSAMIEFKAPQVTATSGNATTMAATGMGTFADDDFNGGYLKLVSKVAGSTNTDPIGTMYEITDFTYTTDTFTFAAAGGAITAGDVFSVFPPIAFAKGNFNAAFDQIVLTTADAIPVKVCGWDIPRNKIIMSPTLHQNGGKTA
jgi:hypothetical protein